ncbi:hypothetical protein CCHL11_04618 [Colletotrichum chlorophyti]|uniref:Peptidase A1 domain-containing protein n=1 Tax=Colletotrichum chlorophyti TaxID=708187 RepID=A0A1Q8RRH2_9PEZI|nr:hypothetical protein CCHL11_04618 [Colletotrichum chlorophyti]
MRMSTLLNNTRVRNSLDCPDNNTYAFIGCQGASGSVYDATRGSFAQVYNINDWNVTTVDQQPDEGSASVLHGYDVANFTDKPAVTYGFPLEVWADFNSMNRSAIALGPDSSTISSFVRNKLVPTEAFSIDFGSTSESYSRDGQIVFGGVNEARYNESTKVEFPLWGAGVAAPCPLQVLIADVVVTNKNGDTSLMSDPNARIPACIDTVQNSFSLTTAMFSKLQTIGNHIATDGKAFGDAEFPADRESLLGSLTIKLSNGYTTVIPHYEFVSHVRGTDSRGTYAVLNNTRITANVASGLSDLGNNITILGGIYLSQNYLHVDYKANKFWLSPQVKNGTLPNHITASCNGTTEATTKNGSALGLKIGVPVAIGAAMIALLALWFWLKNRKRTAKSAGPIRSIPRGNEKRDAPDSKSSTTQFAGYHNVNQTNAGVHMELEGDLGRQEQQRAELPEPAPAYSRQSDWPRMNSIQGEHASYYRQFEEPGVESYELADTSPNPQVAVPAHATPPPPPPPPLKRHDSELSDNWLPSPATLRKQPSNFSDVVSPTSTVRANSTRQNPHNSPF